MKSITIQKRSLSECVSRKKSAEEDIVAYAAMKETTTGQDDILELLIDDISSVKSRMDDYIRHMETAGRDYLYTRANGEILKYEIGDLLFQ